MGLWAAQCRKSGGVCATTLGRDDLKLLFNVNAEFAAPLGRRAIESRAASAVFSSMADAVLVSGSQ